MGDIIRAIDRWKGHSPRSPKPQEIRLGICQAIAAAKAIVSSKEWRLSAVQRALRSSSKLCGGEGGGRYENTRQEEKGESTGIQESCFIK